MNKITYKDIKETIHHHTLKNGLNVYLLQKENTHKIYTTISTNFGSINTTLTDNTLLPEGIAHFLEHKLFEQNNEDISKQFALNQASVNAYTQNSRTTYLFNCTDNFYVNLELLLHFVFHPQFTPSGIENEKKIIEQEIKMYLDNPNTVLYNGIMNNLFITHPIKNEILGSIESISHIDKDILEKTHKEYYHPQNMLLFIAGNINVEETIKFLEEHCTTDFGDLEKLPKIKEEELKINKATDQAYKDIILPNYLLGIKLPGTKKEDIMKQELAIGVLLDLIIGKTTDIYQELLSEGLINDSFGLEISLHETYGYILLGSESSKVEELHKKLITILQNLDVSSIKEEDFLRNKKQTLGNYIHSLNSIEFIASAFTKYHYQNDSLFNILSVSRDLTLQDLLEVTTYFTNKDLYSKYTVYPKKDEE